MKKMFLPLFIIAAVFVFRADLYAQSNNVLLEFSTGTWCQWCPCGDNAVENILQNFPNTMVLAYHGGGGGDPFQSFNGNSILSLLGIGSAYPTGVVGRRTGVIGWNVWNNPVVNQSYTVQPSVSYSVTKTYNPSTRQLQVTANVTSLRQIDTNTNINFVITEDGVVYSQINNGVCTTWTGSYTHKWIVRNMVNGATGEALSTGSWAANTVKTASWTTTLDNSWVDANCNVNVFVYFATGNLSSDSYIQQTYKQAIIPSGINSQNNKIPMNYSLSQNYPNPFNPSTNIKFAIPKEGNVSLKVYDMLGNVVTTFVDGYMKAGTYNAEFDGSNFASGIYFYQLNANGFSETKKMSLIK